MDVPLCLSYYDVLALPATTLDGVIACAGNSPGGHCIGQATWQGIAMKTLLSEVAVAPQAHYAHLFAADGYTTCITMAQLRDSILVYGMNDNLLPLEHGYPTRLIVPGVYGYKMPKWLQRITLAETPMAGLWEQRGWSGSGEARIMSQITSPHHETRVQDTTTLHGIAYAGTQAVKAVELSMNGGPWMPVQVIQTAPNTLAQWSIEWTPSAPGQHRITVRAIDTHGTVQANPPSSSLSPNGASSLHAITLYA